MRFIQTGMMQEDAALHGREEKQTVTFKVLTFNIHHGRGVDGQLNLERTAKVIRACDADVICLNEVDRNYSKRSAYMDQAKWLAQQLQMNVVFGPSISKTKKRKKRRIIHRHEYGNALMTRYKIKSSQNHLWKTRYRFLENRSFLEANILLYRQYPVTVIVTHLSLNPTERSKQIDFFLDQTLLSPCPVLIAGDMNMKPGSRPWQRINKYYQDVWFERHADSGFTFPSLRPSRRLDYIFVDQSFAVIDAEVVFECQKASDHLPVLARLALKKNSMY